MANTKKTFEISHKVKENNGDGKEMTLIVKFCCEKFWQYYNTNKSKYDRIAK
jgi:hypothetical protein